MKLYTRTLVTDRRSAKAMFDRWKQENTHSDLTFAGLWDNTKHYTINRWWYISTSTQCIGFVVVNNVVNSITVLYVNKPHRNRGHSLGIINYMNTDRLTLDRYTPEQLSRLRQHYSAAGYTKHVALVAVDHINITRLVGEFLAREDCDMSPINHTLCFVDIDELHSNSLQSVVRFQDA